MALITRITRLFRADLHAVLDRIEEPDVLLRQAVREMEAELEGDEQRLRRMQHEQARIAARRQELTQALARMEPELDLCFASAREDLARALVKRQLETQRGADLLARREAALRDLIAALAARIAENRARLDGMRQKAELLAEEVAGGVAADACPNGDLAAGTGVRDEEVEVAFLREKHRRVRS